MATLTEMVAAVVVHSSAAAFSHFGVVLDGAQLEPRAPAAVEQRVVARTPRNFDRLQKANICPDAQRLRINRA